MTRRPLQRLYKKPSPHPWTIRCQTAPNGRQSRFELLDVWGKKVRLTRPGNRAVLRHAPELFELVVELSDLAEMQRLMLSSEFGHNVDRPVIGRARDLLMAMQRECY